MPPRRPKRPEDALARVVLDRYLGLRRGESVTIEAWNHALPWARSLVIEARRRGAHPTLIIEDESAFFRSLELLGSAVLSEPATEPTVRGDACIYFGGPEAFPRLMGLPADDREALLARRDRTSSRNPRSPRARTIRIAIGDVSATAADRYGVGVEAWTRELLNASLVDPMRLEATGRRLARSFSRAHRVRIRHPNGTDLEFRLGDRAPILDSGRPAPGSRAPGSRVPAGILILPIGRGSANGVWEANRPAYDRFVVPPTTLGGHFEFRAGRLRRFTFDQGGEPFALTYARAGPGRERAVALTIGLNPGITDAPEALELGLGTLGLLIGDSPFPGRQPRSGFSFLAALADADVVVDGRPWRFRERPVTRPRR
jgi:leucyl aminopeptidase (aminopeptidase T)